MQMSEILSQMGGLESIARELGVNQSQAASGAEALLPAILGGFKKQAQAHPEGLQGFGGLLQQLGGGELLDNVLSPQPTDVSRGNDVLGQIFGSKDVSRTVADHAATQSGLEPSLLKKMLPMLAMVAAGYMARQHGAAAAGQATASQTAAGQAAPEAGGLGGMLKGLIGSLVPGAGGTAAGGIAGLASMLDLNRDGNPLDDILRMATGKTSG